MTFNHGVEGSSTSALTNKTGSFLNFNFPDWSSWEAHGKREVFLMPIDDPATWSQGALAFKSIFDGLRSAISLVREARGSRDSDQGKEETKLIVAALEKASTATAIAEAEVAKALGFELCKCQFPPIPMLTVGHIDNPNAKMVGPIYECPKCGYNSARVWSYTRTSPPRAKEAASS
jgi:hypothetical protein